MSQCRKRIRSFVKVLTVIAKLIASLLRPVLYHPLMELTDEDTLALLSSEFWVRLVYEELLHAASRFNLSREAEYKKPPSNLVKIACVPCEREFFFSNAALLKTVAVMFLLELVKKKSSKAPQEPQNQTQTQTPPKPQQQPGSKTGELK